MSNLFILPGSVRRDPAIDAWFDEHEGELGEMARRWFQVMRECGAELDDPVHLLEGTGKLLRHAKLRPTGAVDDKALTTLIRAAYTAIRQRQ